MGDIFGRTSTSFGACYKSGADLEGAIALLLKACKVPFWRNVKVQTKLTIKGETEVDVAFLLDETLYLVECKNVKAIKGEYNDMQWAMAGTLQNKWHTKLNTIAQCNLHQSSVSDEFYKHFKEFPKTDTMIVVPDACQLSKDIEQYIYTFSEFKQFIERMHCTPNTKMKYRLVTMFGEEG